MDYPKYVEKRRLYSHARSRREQPSIPVNVSGGILAQTQISSIQRRTVAICDKSIQASI